MPVTSVTKDPAALTMTVVAEFPVPVERLWDAYADPRQLEKFWGPPSWPATFTRHDFAVGGRSDYYMTGPEGETSGGSWRFLSVEPCREFVAVDAFANDGGGIDDGLPAMRMVFSFDATDSGSRMTCVTTFPDVEGMETVLSMGMEEGMTLAMGQMDAVLADLASFAADRTVGAQVLSDTQIRVTRVIRGTVDQVWEAHHNPDLLKR